MDTNENPTAQSRTNGDRLRAETARLLAKFPQILTNNPDTQARIRALLANLETEEGFADMLIVLTLILASDKTGRLMDIIGRRVVELTYHDAGIPGVARIFGVTEDQVEIIGVGDPAGCAPEGDKEPVGAPVKVKRGVTLH